MVRVVVPLAFGQLVKIDAIEPVEIAEHAQDTDELFVSGGVFL